MEMVRGGIGFTEPDTMEVLRLTLDSPCSRGASVKAASW
jgi:hypothetical protein